MRTRLIPILAALVLPAGLAFADPQGDQPGVSTMEVSQGPSTQQAQQNLVFKAFGGVEGYSGTLAGHVDPGPSYGASVAYEPSRSFGIELGYSGGQNELRRHYTGGVNPNPNGSDLVRNGGYLALTPGVAMPLNANGSNTVKPYVLVGAGIDDYEVRGLSGTYGYHTAVVGTLPFGLGVETAIGAFRADARFNSNYVYGNSFYNSASHPWRYQGTVHLGAAF